MAYAEKRGRYWRGRYKNPPGVRPKWGTVSEKPDKEPFLRRIDAEIAAEDKEAQVRKLIGEWQSLTAETSEPRVDGTSYDDWLRTLEMLRRRANGGRNPAAGEISLREWVETKWWPAQDLAPRSLRRYGSTLRNHILPAFGDRPLVSLSDPQEITVWERGLRGRYAPNTVQATRRLLALILGDAKDAGLIEVNPALWRRGRGRTKHRNGGRATKVSTKVWGTPLQVLLIAERCALLTGRDDHLLMWLTCGWCGLRWGELNGLTYGSFRDSRLFIDKQLGELDGGWVLDSPKFESCRNDERGYFGALDLPPFLVKLWTQRLSRSRAECRCAGACGGSEYVFLGARSSHFRHSDYCDTTWHPAVSGVYPQQTGQRLRPARPVLVDLSAGWPGKPHRPAWPYASGPDWTPPSTRRSSRKSRGSTRLAEAELASWLPIKPNLTPHGLRHSHKVWMDEDRIPDVLKHDRMGHIMPGIGGTYSHVSPAMREELKDALQARWEQALAQRAALSPRSPVPLLDALLRSREQSTSPLGAA